ncbi:MAG: regulatory protein TetR [Herbaspirillum sp.]|jgi:AcrR family transcriptional regulator|nr:regulatory protein TetR [Herbaspirillum sp.]
MGRKRNFSREGVLDKAIQVFWQHGYADTSLQDLEQATGVNKSGLYSEFEDKEDLFLSSLRHYASGMRQKDWLTAEPLGWDNIERLLKLGWACTPEQKGCFCVNSIREVAMLPAQAQLILQESQAWLKQGIANNLAAEKTSMPVDALAEIVMIFYFGICMDQSNATTQEATTRKIDTFMQVMRAS